MIHLSIKTFFIYLWLIPIQAQSPLGIWVTVDDKRNVEIAHVEIYKENDMLYGKVIKLLPEAETRTCIRCPGDLKGKPLVGLVMVHDLNRNGDSWTSGKIMDPKSGRSYDCSLWLYDKNTLKIRASFGISLFGRTQTWERLESSKVTQPSPKATVGKEVER